MLKAQMEEKIKRLEQKNHDLESKVSELEEGAFQVSRLMDAIIAETCTSYGEEVYDDVEPPMACKLIGYRLEIPVPDVEVQRKLHVEKRNGKLIVGYMIEENEND